MYKAIIFDFFGVIHSDPYQKWLNKHGFRREGEFAEVSDIVDKNLISWDEFFEKLRRLSGQPVASIKDAFYEDDLIDGEIIKLIKQLKKDYKIGLLSNANREYLRPMLKKHNIERIFDADIISSEVGIIKPDIEIFKLTLDRLDTEPRETVFIDDNSYNTEAAKSIGISPILYRDLAKLKEELADLGVKTG